MKLKLELVWNGKNTSTSQKRLVILLQEVPCGLKLFLRCFRYSLGSGAPDSYKILFSKIFLL